jgi:hypothetical protein
MTEIKSTPHNEDLWLPVFQRVVVLMKRKSIFDIANPAGATLADQYPYCQRRMTRTLRGCLPAGNRLLGDLYPAAVRIPYHLYENFTRKDEVILWFNILSKIQYIEQMMD